MKTRTTALLAGALMLLMAVPASAAHTYVGTATGSGLRLTLAGNGLTVGFSEAAVQSAASEVACGKERGVACARAAGELTVGETAEAHAPGNEDPEETTAFPIPEDFSPLATGQIGIARALASITGDDSTAQGEGGAIRLSLTATQTLAEALPLQDAIGQVSDNILTPIAEGDPTGLGERVKGTVDTLNERLADTPLLTLNGGPSVSEAKDIDGVTSANATARGAVITLVPAPETLQNVVPDGLVVVEVGEARAEVSTDQKVATADFSPAIVTLKVFNPTENAYDVVQVAPGASECGGEAPLVLCVTAGGGNETIEGAGAAAEAAGVSIRAFADPLPELRLELAAVEAAVNAAPPAPAPSPSPTAPTDVSPSTQLPRTGGGLPALALLGMSTLGWYGVRRRR
jgi:hypothetical protein